jgi:hypothetical protein
VTKVRILLKTYQILYIQQLHPWIKEDKIIYLTLCTFSFEIKESSLSDARCLIQDVVSPHCGDKIDAATMREIFSSELFCHDAITLKCGENTSM